ncbi:Short-chain dehydrogenase [Micromonospora pallida]|uniref:Short-chain dehydrogenase n=1 Tax=Micromonospora pallida TaxID=145854 RepID=A0A1C6SB02_9ACTN|nr:SDR family NAD(P)-dependent oxidoreductase [Micromonospora pallida]SCL26645.1 Short-chain dehydrogenase [Micromonospora pallida]
MTDRRTALITGATGGLGAAVAARLGELGHRVVLAGRDADAAAAIAKDLAERTGATTDWIGLDVTDPASVDAARDAVGAVDILVNSAGVLVDPGQNAKTIPMELVEQSLTVNTIGTWRVSQAFLPGMLERRWGRIVNISSGTASFTHGLFGGAPAYSLSKVALNALTVMLAESTKDSGVLVNAVNPGRVRTRMQPTAQRSPEEAAEGIVWAATLPDDGPTGSFLRGDHEIMGW